MKSFTERVRDELAENMRSAQCCRRSMLCGILINADCSPDGGIYVKLSGRTASELMLKLLRETYGREGVADYSNSYGRVSAEIGFTSEKLADRLRELSLEDEADELAFFKCKDCAAAFCAGIILSAAAFSNPERESRLEIRINDPARAARVCSFFDSLGHTPTRSERDGISSLIFKRADTVEDLLTVAGAYTSAMELMQGKLMRELRGEVNRQSNCDVKNIGRTAAASRAQIEAIAYLRDSGRFTSLPDELKETAMLREAEPELPMSELAARHSPPITKSGLNHRLNKILALAKDKN